MNGTNRTVQMFLINPGEAADDGDFIFDMEPRVNAGRVVKFALNPQDAETLHKALGEFLKVAK